MNQSPLNQAPSNQVPLNQVPLNQVPLNQDPLAQLRDIHLPEAISWWPPAPGWWLLAIILLVSVVLLFRYLLRRRQQLYFCQQALNLLSQCWINYQQGTEQLGDCDSENGSDHNSDQQNSEKHKDRQFIEDTFAIIRRAMITSRTGNTKAASHTPEHQDNQLTAISSEQVLDILNSSTNHELSTQVSSKDIDALLYQAKPQPLKKEQAEQLYAAARRYLKRGVQQGAQQTDKQRC